MMKFSSMTVGKGQSHEKVNLSLFFLCFLAIQSHYHWGVAEGMGIGLHEPETGTKRIQIQQQDITSGTFKNFFDPLNQESRKMGDGGDGGQASSPQWETVIDPRFYIITEYDEDSLTNHPYSQTQISEVESPESGFSRLRRNSNTGHSLSIVNPLDVLRQRFLLEIARRRNLKQNQHQIIANAEILKNIG